MRNEDYTRQPILIFGAGNNGRVAAEEVQRDPLCRYKIIGFVDDNPDLKNRKIWGFKVLGGRGNICTLLTRLGIDHLLVSTLQIDPKQLAEELLAQGVNPTIYFMQITWHAIEDDQGDRRLRASNKSSNEIRSLQG